MGLSEEQVKEAKRQLKEQVQHLPPEQRKEAERQIDELSVKAIEELVRQQSGRQKIFRMIASKQVESVVVDENAEAIAVLSIRALSKGHILVIPKEVVSDKKKMPQSIIDFATSVGKRIQDSLKPEKVDIKIEEKFGEVILEIVPNYGEPLKEKEVKKSELEKVLKEINVVKVEKKVEKVKMKEPVREKPLKLGRRIP